MWWKYSRYFNTSHVTVYHWNTICSMCRHRISIHLMLRFIGTGQDIKDPLDTDFNTSHVTVYQRGKCVTGIMRSNFNTSHVTVYRDLWDTKVGGILISIHLMLRFIEKRFYGKIFNYKFQYISCYGLSITR